MDFGIDRLIEMIEQRINRTVANAVLYVLTAAALVWGLQIVGSFTIKAVTYIHGLILYFRGAKAPVMTPNDVLGLVWSAASIVLALVIYLAGMLVIRRRIIKGVTASLTELDSITTDCKAFSDRTHAEVHRIIEKLKIEADEIVDQAKRNADQILADAEVRVKSLVPSPQLPPDTESKKQP